MKRIPSTEKLGKQEQQPKQAAQRKCCKLQGLEAKQHLSTRMTEPHAATPGGQRWSPSPRPQ